MGASEFRAALVAAGLAEFADTLAAMVEPGVRLSPVPGDDAELPLGATKLGGRPDLVPGTPWPEFRGLPHSFVAQVNLADVADLPGAQRLPSSGLLSFFFDSRQEAWGFDPSHRGGCRVLYSPASAALQRAAFPAMLAAQARSWGLARFASRGLRVEPIMTYPHPDSSDVLLGVPQLDDLSRRGDRAANSSRAMAYAVVYDAFAPMADGPHNRLLGHPMLVQGDLQQDAQLAFHGVPPFDPSVPRDPRCDQLEPGARCWRLLLQIDSVEDIGMMWGDVGCIYFLIRDQDLAAVRGVLADPAVQLTP